MFNQTQEVRSFKSEKRVFTSGQGETTTTVTEIVETSDGGSQTVQRTVTTSSENIERSPGFSSHLKAFQDMSASTPHALAPKPKGSLGSSKGPEAASSSAPVSASLKTFQEDSLKWHNYYRQKHGVLPLKMSPTLNVIAQEWADNIAKTNNFQHRPNNNYGENIYNKSTSNSNYQCSGKEAVDAWYSEIKDYTFGAEPRSMGTGHFTQVVWKSSTELGIGYAKACGGRHYVVANYNPAGNFRGQYTANVAPPK